MNKNKTKIERIVCMEIVRRYRGGGEREREVGYSIIQIIHWMGNSLEMLNVSETKAMMATKEGQD